MHSDFLNPLGPRPIIVGLSLGACRTFRLQQTDEEGRVSKKVDIPMPHNSMIIMMDDCQVGGCRITV